MIEKMLKYRRDLHQIPELGFDLELTYAYVKEKLESFGYEPKTYAKTGLVAVKEGINKDAVGFRADMDALPIKEDLNIEFKSRFDGRMHACAHDGHTSMLLGFAEYVSKLEMLNQSIVFIFQPAEEGPGGAKVMINEGVLKDYHVKSIFGLHIFPGLDEGKFGIISGPMLAGNAEFDFTVHGYASHGAQPQQGKDAVLAASGLVVGFSQIISKFIDPIEPAVISTGMIHGGDAKNVIANHAHISGTMRAFNKVTFDILKEKMLDTAKAVEIQYGVEVKGKFIDLYPPVNNDHHLYNIVKNVIDKDAVVHIKPYTFSEDFAFYQKHIPGMFTFIGSRNTKKGYIYPLHNERFNFDEKILMNGLNYYIELSKALGLFKV